MLTFLVISENYSYKVIVIFQPWIWSTKFQWYPGCTCHLTQRFLVCPVSFPTSLIYCIDRCCRLWVLYLSSLPVVSSCTLLSFTFSILLPPLFLMCFIKWLALSSYPPKFKVKFCNAPVTKHTGIKSYGLIIFKRSWHCGSWSTNTIGISSCSFLMIYWS